ncbi:MAG: hypothetical protein ACPG9U_11340, partial [Paracoccaceae bacterium]
QRDHKYQQSEQCTYHAANRQHHKPINAQVHLQIAGNIGHGKNPRNSAKSCAPRKTKITISR